jgi:hypothetical protein
MAELKKFGEMAFVIGVIIAVIVGIFSASLEDWAGLLSFMLVILGLVVGILNVSESETTPFLVAAAALMLTATSVDTLKQIVVLSVPLGKYLAGIVSQIAVFVAPAAAIVAIKAIKSLARD